MNGKNRFLNASLMNNVCADFPSCHNDDLVGRGVNVDEFEQRVSAQHTADVLRNIDAREKREAKTL